MFERYNEPARRVVFFGRYEASKLGSTVIETEHLLLGLLREDWNLIEQHRPGATTDIRRRIRERNPARPEVSQQSIFRFPLSAGAFWRMPGTKQTGCSTAISGPTICC